MSKIWDNIPSPYKSGAQKPPFWTPSQLNGYFNVLYLRNEILTIGQLRLQLQGVSYIVPKCHELWSTNSFKRSAFSPPYVISAFHFIARLRRRRSANGTQPHFVKRSTVGRSNNVRRKVGVVPPEKNGVKNFYICSVFRRLRHLMANIC